LFTSKSYKAAWQKKDENGQTALTKATKRGDIEIVMMLLLKETLEIRARDLERPHGITKRNFNQIQDIIVECSKNPQEWRAQNLKRMASNLFALVVLTCDDYLKF